MPSYTAEQLQAWTSGTWHRAHPGLTVRGFSFDGRQIRPGEAFLALRTDKRDGHAYVNQAAARGAAAALVESPDASAPLPQLQVTDVLAALHAVARENRRRFKGPVVGVTGSCGKTSTKDLLALLLGKHTHATEGNLNNLIGAPLTLTALDPARHEAAVIEAGMNTPGEMAQLAGLIEPDLAIVTLVAPAHLEGLGTIENVAREKAELPRGVRAGGWAVLPASCLAFSPFHTLPEKLAAVLPEGASLPPHAKAERVFRFRLEPTQDARWTLLFGPEGTAPARYALPAVSPGMAGNAALALAAATLLGIEPALLADRILQWRPSQHRGELHRAGDRLLYVDCYNANPASMIDAFAAFDRLADAALPRLYVLGCMAELGPTAPALHRDCGSRLRLRPADRAFVVGAQAEDFATGLRDAGTPAAQIAVVSDVEEIRPVFETFSGAVLLKGSRAYKLERLLPAALQTHGH